MNGDEGPTRRKKGQLGEDFAAWILDGLGYELIERNWQTRFGEIDLIVRAPEGTLCFVEVRTTTTGEGTAFGSLHPRKRSRLARQATYYLAEKRWRGPARIDFIANEIHDGFWVSLHLENAFGQGGR
jgi:putative endonuclease